MGYTKIIQLTRIYTEDKPNLPKLAAQCLPEFTIIKGLGYWNGVEEAAAIIEVVVSSGDTRFDIKRLTELIKSENKQTAVLVTCTPIGSEVL